MEKKIITISREFGSGGRTIGHKVAERLGIPFYDKELVNQVALESGFAPKFVEEHGEHSPSSSLFSYAFAPQGVPGVMKSCPLPWALKRPYVTASPVSKATREPVSRRSISPL